ncbi:hypothetical protein GAY28_16025 [Azospirillum brasilense]|nr:hypothetical protein [Azospirillum brasilense]
MNPLTYPLFRPYDLVRKRTQQRYLAQSDRRRLCLCCLLYLMDIHNHLRSPME